MSDQEFDPPSPIHLSQLDPEEAERLMQQSELFTEQSQFDNEGDLDMLREGKYEEYITQKLGNLNMRNGQSRDNINGNPVGETNNKSDTG